jgi:XTP/dITP diphosphohydrolase
LAERRLLIASGNPGKLHEYRELLAGTGLELAGWETGAAEDRGSYAANATVKAEAACAASGLRALGDDSGLEVAALEGFPGLHSARLGVTQQEREQLLFARLTGIPRPWKARFVCALALAFPGQRARVFMGVREGEVVEARKGGTGFGYDPVFLVPEVGKTFAEMSGAEKHRWSHRGVAVRALLKSGALAEISGDR